MVFNVPVHKSSGAHTSPKTVPEAADAEKIPRKYCSSDNYAYICTPKGSNTSLRIKCTL